MRCTLLFLLGLQQLFEGLVWGWRIGRCGSGWVLFARLHFFMVGLAPMGAGFGLFSRTIRPQILLSGFIVRGSFLSADLLVHCGIALVKYYLDISRAEQKTRLKHRRDDPLIQWKSSPIDAATLKHCEDYSAARGEMLGRTHTMIAPWTIARADNKPLARINIIRNLLMRLDYTAKSKRPFPRY